MSVWWRWMRDALSPTDDEVARLVEPGPEGWRADAERATQAMTDEVNRLGWPVSPVMFQSCTKATEPTDIEVTHLLVGLRESPSTGTGQISWIRPLVLAGAAVSVAGLTLLHSPGPSQFGADTTILWSSGEPVVLNAAITVDGTAQVQVTQTALAGTRIDLQQGSAWFEVDPLGAPQDRSLLVVAGNVKVRVKGTRFRVARSAERIAVSVARGTVEVANGDDVFLLNAGQEWRVSAQPIVGPLAALADLADEFLPILPAAKNSLPKPAEERLSPRAKPVAEILERILPETQSFGVPSAEPDVATPPPAVAPLAADGSSMARDQWVIIQKQIRNGESQIIAALDRFLAHHGQTRFGEEARIERLRILTERRDPNEALAEIDLWIAGYPDSEHQVLVHNLRAGITLEQMNDCSAAMPSLVVVSTQGTGMDAATATAWVGSCALMLGDADRAVIALTEALEMALPKSLEGQVRADLREAKRRTRRSD
jgi:predicted negative regulator of RcsB-dependent stress response